jgi:hypothetical protein
MASRRQFCSRGVGIALVGAAAAACAVRRPAGAAARCAAPRVTPPHSLTLTHADGEYALTLVVAGPGAPREAAGTLTLTGTDSAWSYPYARYGAAAPDSFRRQGVRSFGAGAAVPLAAVGVAWPGTRPAGAGPDSLVLGGHEFHCDVPGTCLNGAGMPKVGLLLRHPVRPGEPEVVGPWVHGDARWPRLVPTWRDAAGFAGRWSGGASDDPPGRDRHTVHARGYFCAVRRPAAVEARRGAAR